MQPKGTPEKGLEHPTHTHTHRLTNHTLQVKAPPAVLKSGPEMAILMQKIKIIYK